MDGALRLFMRTEGKQMATITSKDIIDELIKNDGYCADDPRVYQIVEYTNAYGNKTWGVTWSNEAELSKHRYEIPSQFVREPKVIWRAVSH